MTMNISKTALDGVIIIEPDVFSDHRGWFYESYSLEKLEKHGIDTVFIQDNHAMSRLKGTLRGLHFQKEPYAQAKLVRCTRGEALDVVVDIRADSSTYCKWVSVILSAENQRQLYIPKGIAHGYLTLADNTEIQYKADAYYSPEHDRCIRYDDPAFGIEWSIDHPILSDRDKTAPLFADIDNNIIPASVSGTFNPSSSV